MLMSDMVRLAAELDANGQHDLADQMDRIAQIDDILPGLGEMLPEESGYMDWFDPNSPHIRAPDEEGGPSRWVGEGVLEGLKPSEFEIVERGDPMGPDATWSSGHSVDHDNILDTIQSDIEGRFRPGESSMAGDTFEESISRLIFAEYITLLSKGDEGRLEEIMAAGIPDIDPVLWEEAKQNVKNAIQQRYEEVEGRVREEYEPYDPRPDRWEDDY